jgi:hypothetical protein
MIFYALDDHHVVRLFDQGLEHVREQAAGMAGLQQRIAVAVPSRDTAEQER